MSCFGLRFFRRKRAPAATGPNDEGVERQPRPFSGSTAVGTSTGVDTTKEEKEQPRSRLRTVGDRLGVPTGALASVLRSRSKSRSTSRLRQPSASRDDEKVEDEKPRRYSGPVVVPGPAWPLKDGEGNSLARHRTSSTSSGSDSDEEKKISKRSSPPLGDPQRDSKLKDEGLVDDSEEELRKRKMEEARRKAEQEEQERLDSFQLM